MAFEKVLSAQLEELLRQKRYVVLLIDASWNVQGWTERRTFIEEAVEPFGDRVVLVEMDWEEGIPFVNRLGLTSVPNVAYFRDGTLVKLVVGWIDVKSQVVELLEQ